jgi:hypothetical protein
MLAQMYSRESTALAPVELAMLCGQPTQGTALPGCWHWMMVSRAHRLAEPVATGGIRACVCAPHSTAV